MGDLRLAADERRQAPRGAHLPPRPCLGQALQGVKATRQALHPHRRQGTHPHEAFGTAPRRLGEVDPARGCCGGHLLGQADHGADHLDAAGGILPGRPDHGLAGVQGDPQAGLTRAAWGHALPHVESRPAGANSVILLGKWCPEHGGHAVAARLDDGPARRAHGRHHGFQSWIEIPHQELGVRFVPAGKDQVRGQHRDLLPLGRDRCRGLRPCSRGIGWSISPGLVHRRPGGGPPLWSCCAPSGGKKRRSSSCLRRPAAAARSSWCCLASSRRSSASSRRTKVARASSSCGSRSTRRRACSRAWAGSSARRPTKMRSNAAACRRASSRSAVSHAWKAKLAGRSSPSSKAPRKAPAAWTRDGSGIAPCPCLHQLPQGQEVDGSIVGGEGDGVAIGDDPAPSRLVDEAAQLGKAPAQRAPGIVGHVPQELAQPLASVRSAGRDQIGEERPGLLRGRQHQRLGAARHLEFAEQSDRQHACLR